MALVRRKVKVSEYYGKSSTNAIDEKAKASLLRSEQDFRKHYDSLGREQKAKISKEEGIERAQKLVAEAKRTSTIDDMDMVLKKSGDIPLSLAKLQRLIKEKLNDDLYIEANILVGQNVGGHAVRLKNLGAEDGFLPVCGVGKAGNFVISPETEFQEVFDGAKNVRKIAARGWIPAIQTIVSFLQSNKFKIKNQDFVKQMA